MRYRSPPLPPPQKTRILGYKEAGLWRGIPAVYTLHAGDISAGAQKTDHREWRCMNGKDCLPSGAAPASPVWWCFVLCLFFYSSPPPPIIKRCFGGGPKFLPYLSSPPASMPL